MPSRLNLAGRETTTAQQRLGIRFRMILLFHYKRGSLKDEVSGVP